MVVPSYVEDVKENPRLQVVERYPSGAPKYVVEKSKYQPSSGQGQSEFVPVQIWYNEQGRRTSIQEQTVQSVGRDQRAPVPTRSETYDAEAEEVSIIEYPTGYGFPEAGSSSESGSALSKKPALIIVMPKM